MLIKQLIAGQKDADRRDEKRHRIERLTLAAVVLYAAIAALTWFALLSANKTTEKIAADAQKSANAAVEANKLAEGNALAARDTARQDQRAWLGVKAMRLSPLKVGEPVSAEIAVSNTGRSIARKATMKATMIFSRTPVNIPQFAVSKERPILPSQAPVVFFPGFEFSLSAASKEIVANEDQLKSILASQSIYYFGEINYLDVFDRPHVTLFCGIYAPTKKAFDACPWYNDAD